MPWGAVAGAAIGVIGDSMNSGGGGGGGGQQQTASKEPWMPVQPWILNNVVQGQNLQNQYTAQPFNAQQTTAYNNQNAQSDYMRAAIPSLLSQMSGKQLGFDRSNPNARPEAFDFNTLLSADKLGSLASLRGQSMSTMPAPQQAAPEPTKAEEPKFVNNADGYNDLQRAMQQAGFSAGTVGQPGLVVGQQGNGSYGSWTYGQEAAPGTKAYQDMMGYFMMGGADPWGLNPMAQKAVNPLYNLGNSGNSVNGSPAADGSGGGTPGGNW